MKIEFAGDTHVGMKREHNEDSLLVMQEHSLFVVADGMGGHASGDVASRLAVDTIRRFFLDTAKDKDITWPFPPEHGDDYHANRLVAAIKLANQSIVETSLDKPQMRGMGTTAVALYFVEDRVYVAHVGDSRCYRFSGGKLGQVTEDHSLLNDFRRNLNLTPEQERNFPHKNIIVRALGMKQTVDVDMQILKPEIGDIFVLCSDGLSGEVSDDELRNVLSEEKSLIKASRRLVRSANDHGGNDNITVILIRTAQGESPALDQLAIEVTKEMTDVDRTVE